jgi:hypothetical protein
MSSDRLVLVERRLTWHPDGVTEAQLKHSLGWPVGVGAVCRELAGMGKAHRVGDRWYHGPGVAPGRPRPASTRTIARDLVLGDLRANPGTSAGEIARRLNCPSSSVSTALQDLRRLGQAVVQGQRVAARWTAATEADTLPSAPPLADGSPGTGEQRDETSSVHDAGLAEGAALLTWLMDELGIPPAPDLRVRVGVVVGMWRQLMGTGR